MVVIVSEEYRRIFMPVLFAAISGFDEFAKFIAWELFPLLPVKLSKRPVR